ncbi:RDD family protein [Archangium minus]|uniref:RDD family protein n=2 Tax=Archangium minus TaxID=83450 RepID=A0ABY9XAC2_9BACT|nr:RDD family protein [Archangium minus]
MAPVPPPVAPATPPGMTARAPVPPGMTPAGQAPRPQQAPGLPVMPPRAQAPAAQMAPKAPAAPAPRPVAAPSAPMAPPAHAQAAAPRAPTPPPQAPSSVQLPGVAAPAPRANTPAFGVSNASAPAPALKQASPEEESFSVDVDDSEAETLPATPMPTPRRPPPPALAPASATAKAPAESGVTEVHARPASLWRRLLAFTIDTGAMAGVAALYLLLASTVAGVHAPQTGLSGLDAFVIQVRALQSVLIPGAVLLMVLSLVYCAVAAFLWNGRTLGRRLLGLRLVDTHGLAPAPGRAIARAVLASLSFGLFLAGFWMALFDRRGQTLHDKLTSTYVVQPS